MKILRLSRRAALARSGVMVGAAVAAENFGLAGASPQASVMKTNRPFRFCLNTATIRGQKVGIVREIEIAAQAGYDSIEPWMDAIEAYLQSGGSLKDLRKRLDDQGLAVDSAIGFPEWIVDDEARRAKGLERAKKEMDWIAQLGGKRVAAPPAGATNLPKLDFLHAVERYRTLLDAGAGIGVVPQLELWGFSKNLSRLGECIGVAIETAHPQACVLADVFHLYKGGSDFHGMHLLGTDAIQVLHMNDYPADIPRERIDDSYRVFPGDGAGPVVELLSALKATGGQKVLSLELFNRRHWSEDPLAVAKAGLAKMQEVVRKAASGSG